LRAETAEAYILLGRKKISAVQAEIRRQGMNKKVCLGYLVMMALLAASAPLAAHHGNASYGHAKQITLKGTVTEWEWLSPHTILKMDVKDEQGAVVNWIVEWNAPSSLINYGITKKTFKPGDEVTVAMITPDNGAPVGRIQRVMLANGTWLRG
jgi:Family of unknown function (DUF6152)